MAWRVMLVDDSAVTRAMLTDILTGLGHEVVAEAARVQEAIETYGSSRPDLVALDLSLLDGSGLDVLRGIRAKDASARVVLITGSDQRKAEEEARSLGALATLTKPFKVKEVVDLLSRIPPP